MISRFVIAFLLRSKHLLIPWLQSLQSSAVISSLIKKVYMQDSTFQLVWKRRISSFKLFVQICGWMISLWSWLGGKSLWPYLFKAYFRPSPGTGSTVHVADSSVMFSCSVTLTPSWIYTPGKFPIYLLWVWPCDFAFAIMTQNRDMKVTYIETHPLLLLLQLHDCYHIIKSGLAWWVMRAM